MIHEVAASWSRTVDYLRQLVADVPDEMLTRQIDGVVNHPAWVIGHVIYSCQAIGGEMGIDPWLAADWAERFGTGTVPVEGRKDYPSKHDLLGALSDAQQRVNDRLLTLGDSGLTVPLPDEGYREIFPTLGHAVLHVLTVHTAIHVGQVTVWRRAVGLGPLDRILA
jgi:hypothetical protein